MPNLTLTGPGGVTKTVQLSANFSSLTPEQQQDTIHQIIGQIFPQASNGGAPKPVSAAPLTGGFAYRGQVIRPPSSGINAGIAKGLRQDIDVPAEALATGVGSVANMFGDSGWHPGQATKAADAANIAAMDAANEGKPGYTEGTAAGQLLGSLPIAAAGGEAVEAIPAVSAAGRWLDALVDTNKATKLALTVPRAAVKGLTPGAIAGADTNPDHPVAGAAAGAEWGAGLGGAVGAAGQITSGAARWFLRNAPDALHNQAVQKILARIAEDEKAGKPKAKDLLEAMKEAHEAGVPLTLMEAGGPNLQGLAGSVARTRGVGRTMIKDSFKDRIQGAPSRLVTATRKAFDAENTMRQTHAALSASQREAADPLYEKAFAPGSLAPLEKQFENEFNSVSRMRKEAQEGLNVAQQGVTLAAAKVARAGNDVYSNSVALKQMEDAQKTLRVAHERLKEVEDLHTETLSNLREAQLAHERGERGGVYSPYIRRLLKNPRVKTGISRGLRIQRDEADAADQPFNPSDYAITGEDEDGDPIVAKVPNMRLLDSAKRGMDAMLEDKRNKFGKLELNEEDRAIAQLRHSLVAELDRLNDDYKAARDAWAGPAASKTAMAEGLNILSEHPEDVERMFKGFSPAQKEHYRIGAAEAYINAIGENGLVAPSVRKLATQEDDAQWARRRLRPIFDNEKQLDQFIKAVSGERLIYDTRTAIVGNSLSAERLAEDAASHGAEAAVNLGHSAAHAAHGNMLWALRSFLRARQNLGVIQNPELNAEIAKQLTSGDPDLELRELPRAPIQVPDVVGGTSALGAAMAPSQQSQ